MVDVCRTGVGDADDETVAESEFPVCEGKREGDIEGPTVPDAISEEETEVRARDNVLSRVAVGEGLVDADGDDVREQTELVRDGVKTFENVGEVDRATEKVVELRSESEPDDKRDAVREKESTPVFVAVDVALAEK